MPAAVSIDPHAVAQVHVGTGIVDGEHIVKVSRFMRRRRPGGLLAIVELEEADHDWREPTVELFRGLAGIVPDSTDEEKWPLVDVPQRDGRRSKLGAEAPSGLYQPPLVLAHPDIPVIFVRRRCHQRPAGFAPDDAQIADPSPDHDIALRAGDAGFVGLDDLELLGHGGSVAGSSVMKTGKNGDGGN